MTRAAPKPRLRGFDLTKYFGSEENNGERHGGELGTNRHR